MICALLAAYFTTLAVPGQVTTPDAGPDWRLRLILVVVTNEQNVVTSQTNAVVELSGGMNRWDDSIGQWVPATPRLTLAENGGAVGTGGRHLATFAANINSAAAVQIRMPTAEGPQWLKMHFLGLFYEDPILRTNVLIADLQDCPAQVTGQQVQYRDAFQGISADIAYNYTALGLSQEILLREPLPDPSLYGLSASSVRLVAISEIADGPDPVITERSWQQGSQTQVDQGLDFGPMRMVPGRAFRLGASPDSPSSLAVLKQYIRQNDGRRLILERLPFAYVQEQLLKLPLPSGNTNGTASIKRLKSLLAGNTLPVRPKVAHSVGHLAKRIASEYSDGFVLDWELVNASLRDFTFQRAPKVSYVLVGDTRLAGTTTINPGAVLRFDSGSLFLDGPLALPAAGAGPSGRKPLLTSVYDENAGPALRSGGPPPPSQYVSALVVRAEDYTNAAQLLEIRHPGARVTPDHPNGLATVNLRWKARTANDSQPSLVIRRLGGDLTQPLTVELRTTTNVAEAFNPQGSSSTVTIPANAASVDVSISRSAPAGAGHTVLTLEPEPNGGYVPGEQLSAGFSTMDSGTISPMSMQAPGGMVGWWKAEGNANDSSGANRNGTAYGGANCVAGWIGQSFNFDGVNDYIQVPDDSALRMGSAMTAEFWLKRQRLTGAYEYLIEKGGGWTGGSQNYALQVHGPDNSLCFTWNWGYRIGGLINDLNWHHCAVTAINGQTDPVLYVDGWPQALSGDRYGGSVSLNASSTLPLHIGAQIDPSYPFYSQTLIDEMSLYNQALSQSQIQSIFNVGRAGKTTQTWWRAENNANDSIGANHGSFNGSYMGGQVGQTFRVVDSSSAVTIPASPSLNVGAGTGFTIEGWMNAYDEDTGGRPVFEWAGPNGGNYGAQMWVNYLGVGNLFINLFDTAGRDHYFWCYPNIQSKSAVHFAVTYDQSRGECQIFINGAVVQTQSVGVFTPQTSYPLYLGYRPANLGGGPRSFNGIIDEVSLYNRALPAADIAAIYTAQSAGKCVGSQLIPPTITSQPQSQTVAAWTTATFTVVANGTAPLSYQWRFNGTDIPGANSSTFSRSNVEPGLAGIYSVLVWNSAGNVTSSAATLIITQPDTDSDGLPDWWELKYFGDLSQIAGGDYDHDGSINSDEYLNSTDPNTITFSTSFPNDHTSSLTTSGTISVLNGVPSQMAVLVDALDHDSASWIPFNSTFVVTLPTGEGRHNVEVGLRGRSPDSEQTWDKSTITRDTTPPTVVITSPLSTSTSIPMMQLQGYSTEPLSSLRFDLSNGNGLQSDLQGLVTEQEYDGTLHEYKKNFFQCYDVDLTSGANNITLRATDLAGNTATVNLSYSLVSDAAAPVVTLIWPENGMKLCGNSFTLNGTVDDPTAIITLTLTPASGPATTYNGLVERDGHFWIENLPLADGVTTLSLAATDAWNNTSTTSLVVNHNTFSLSVDVDSNQLNGKVISLTGGVGASDYTVRVAELEETFGRFLEPSWIPRRT